MERGRASELRWVPRQVDQQVQRPQGQTRVCVSVPGALPSVPWCLPPGLPVRPGSLHPFTVCPRGSELRRVPKAEHRSAQLQGRCLLGGPWSSSVLPAPAPAQLPSAPAASGSGTLSASALLRGTLSAHCLQLQGTFLSSLHSSLSFRIWRWAPCWVKDRTALHLDEINLFPVPERLQTAVSATWE